MKRAKGFILVSIIELRFPFLISNEAKKKNKAETNTDKTEILHGSDNIVKRVTGDLHAIKERFDNCTDSTGPSVFFKMPIVWKEFVELRNRGVKLRFITEITKDNINHSKELSKVVELRHLDGVKGNFGIADGRDYNGSASVKEGEPPIEFIRSNVKTFVEQQQYFFDMLWDKAIPSEQKIMEIEEGIALGTTEVIAIPSRIQELFIDLIKSAKYELLLILPTANSFLREYRLRIIQLLMKVSSSERNVNVRILTPTNDTIEKIMQTLILQTDQEQDKKQRKNFSIQAIKPPTSEAAVSTVTILVVDRKISLVIEKKDDSKEDFIYAVGLATYSTSKPTVSSYVSIFENLWIQTELYEQLKEANQQIALANEQLKIHDKMQAEFINIASHEMKTPTQSILGYSELLYKHPEKTEQMIQAISRNAIRLQKLTNDILEVTRIESQSLKLNIEKLNLNDLISSIVEDYRTSHQLEKENNRSSRVKLLYNKFASNAIILEADKERIIQVISNLLSNAIKFTTAKEEGSISIDVKVQNTQEQQQVQQQKGRQGEGNNNNDNDNQVIISVKDNGEGINSEIIPRLFTKFATKSFEGTGLGLFISKSIVEAHGGRMWAENNADGKGATFYFSLPLSQNNHQQHKLPDTEEQGFINNDKQK